MKQKRQNCKWYNFKSPKEIYTFDTYSPNSLLSPEPPPKAISDIEEPFEGINEKLFFLSGGLLIATEMGLSSMVIPSVLIRACAAEA